MHGNLLAIGQPSREPVAGGEEGRLVIGLTDHCQPYLNRRLCVRVVYEWKLRIDVSHGRWSILDTKRLCFTRFITTTRVGVLSARYSQVINLVARLLSYLLSLFFFPFLFLFFTWSLTLQWEKKTRSLIRFVDSLTRGKKCFVKFVIFPFYIYRYCVLDGDSVTRIARVFLGFKVFWYLSQRKRIYLGEETWRCYDIRGRARPRRLKKKCWRAGSSTSNLFLSGILLDR